MGNSKHSGKTADNNVTQNYRGQQIKYLLTWVQRDYRGHYQQLLMIVWPKKQLAFSGGKIGRNENSGTLKRPVQHFDACFNLQVSIFEIHVTE